MQRNPLLAHLLRKPGPPAVWLTAIFAAVLMGWVIASMQPGLADMLEKNAEIPEDQVWLMVTSLVVLMCAPVMVGVNAAVFTGRHAELDNLKKLKLANVSRADMAWGYFVAALHRMRVPLALAVGLSPGLAIGITEFSLMIYRLFHAECLTSGPCSSMVAAPTFDVTYWLAINGLLAAGVVGFGPLGAALGTWAALIWKRSVIAPGAVVAGIAMMTAAFVAVVGPSEGVPLPVALAGGLGPYALALGVVWLAGRGGADRG